MNHATQHPLKEKPGSRNHLLDAYRLGAEKFGWVRRTAVPRLMQQDGMLVGWGMATATYPGDKMAAAASIRLFADGTAVVQCAAHDIGTGAYTGLTQICAEAIGLPVEQVKFEPGDSSLPFGPVAGGSNTTGTVGSAIYDVAEALHLALAKLASADAAAPLHGISPKKISVAAPGRLSAQ